MFDWIKHLERGVPSEEDWREKGERVEENEVGLKLERDLSKKFEPIMYDEYVLSDVISALVIKAGINQENVLAIIDLANLNEGEVESLVSAFQGGRDLNDLEFDKIREKIILAVRKYKVG